MTAEVADSCSNGSADALLAIELDLVLLRCADFGLSSGVGQSIPTGRKTVEGKLSLGRACNQGAKANTPIPRSPQFQASSHS